MAVIAHPPSRSLPVTGICQPLRCTVCVSKLWCKILMMVPMGWQAKITELRCDSVVDVGDCSGAAAGDDLPGGVSSWVTPKEGLACTKAGVCIYPPGHSSSSVCAATCDSRSTKRDTLATAPFKPSASNHCAIQLGKQ